MLFAANDFGDFALAASVVLPWVLIIWYVRSSTAHQRVKNAAVRRTEHKLDLIIAHLGIEDRSPPREAWQELADDPAQKITAIKAYREHYAVGLAEAKRIVEDYASR